MSNPQEPGSPVGRKMTDTSTAPGAPGRKTKSKPRLTKGKASRNLFLDGDFGPAPPGTGASAQSHAGGRRRRRRKSKRKSHKKSHKKKRRTKRRRKSRKKKTKRRRRR